MERLALPFLNPLFLFLLFTFEPSLAQNCIPSSCGQLREIRYPFRLRTDPPSCGSKNYELLCKENKTFINFWGQDHYYVIDISYPDKTITLLDPAFISGDCTLPSISESYSITGDNSMHTPIDYNCTAFVKCTTQVKQQDYRSMPCLSQNGTHAYAVPYACSASNLKPSCSVLGLSFFNGGIDIDNSSEDIFRVLQKGFTVDFLDDPSVRSILFSCIKKATRMFSNEINENMSPSSLVHSLYRSEKEVLSCAYRNDYPNDATCFHSALAMMIFFWILQLIIILCLLGRVVSALSILLFIMHKFWLEWISIDSIDKFLQDQQRLIAPKRYAYTDIIALTGHFREKLGQGGFGTVFRGTSLSKQVAIKMLGNSKFNGDDFINEVSTLGRIHHVNVVSLLGYCSEGSKRALVYEYMPNGSLDKFIFSRKGIAQRVFSWAKLNELALGIAHGIDYLHRGCDMQILHFDIKPHNILLDNNFNPKISDFGLAKLYPRDHSLVSLSAARGTIGYMAPELVSRSFGVISYKSDVYSFGMLLLEMAGGRRNADPRVENSSQVYYPSWIYDKLKEYRELEISRTCEINTIERKLCIVGLWCIQMQSSDRPPMSRVVEMLEGEADSLEMPPPPFFSSSGSNPISDAFLMGSISIDISTISEEEEIVLLDD